MAQARHKTDRHQLIRTRESTPGTLTQPQRRRRLAVSGAVAVALMAGGVAVMGSGSASGAFVAGPELVVNGSFESGTTGWRTNDRFNTSLSAQDPGHDSATSARLSSSEPRTVVLNDAQNVVASTKRGTRYSVSTWVRSSSANTSGQLRVREVSGGTAHNHAEGFWLVDTDWHHVTFDFTTVTDGGFLDLNVLSWNNPVGRTVSVDLVSMTELTPADDAAPAPTAPTAPSQPQPTTTSAPPPTTAPVSPSPTTPVPPTSTPTTPVPTTPTPTAPEPTPAQPTSPTPTSSTVRTLSNGCSYTLRGVPECGTYLGAAVGGNTDPAGFEKEMGHRLGVHRTYFNADQVDYAVRTAREDLIEGRLPWISFKLPYSWSAMADGKGDRWAVDVAERLKSLDGPVWLAFHHEPEGDGDITQWTRMQEHLGPIVRSTAPNVAFTVILTAWTQLYGDPQYALAKTWPRTKVDVAGFDVYNQYGVTRDGNYRLKPTDMRGLYYEPISAWARAHGVAWGLAETGYTNDAARDDPTWLQQTYKDVEATGGVALSYFNSTLNSIAPWDITTPQKKADFARALKQSPTLPLNR